IQSFQRLFKTNNIVLFVKACNFFIRHLNILQSSACINLNNNNIKITAQSTLINIFCRKYIKKEKSEIKIKCYHLIFYFAQSKMVSHLRHRHVLQSYNFNTCLYVYTSSNEC